MKCKNCKSKSHSTKDCLEKPTSKNIKKAKDVLHSVKKTEKYDEKRDPFKHFDDDMYMDILKKKEALYENQPKIELVQLEVDPTLEENTNFDPSGRTVSHQYRQRADFAEYLKKKDEDEEEGDFVKAKGTADVLAWEKE
eukprot:NODE_120_length_17920_cov_0.559782.p15 type:complete len:139 gc:universal NODE_120_length_17920_cov_0.559782:2169-1753(-)